jgi:hypothetical protein
MLVLIKRYLQKNKYGGRRRGKEDKPGRKPACVPPAAAWSLSTSPLLVSRIWVSSVRGITSLSFLFLKYLIFNRGFLKRLYKEQRWSWA